MKTFGGLLLFLLRMAVAALAIAGAYVIVAGMDVGPIWQFVGKNIAPAIIIGTMFFLRSRP